MTEPAMPAECLARLMDFVSATHGALRSGVYAGELRRRFEAAVVEEAILPSQEESTPVVERGQGECISPAARVEDELRKALAIAEGKLRAAAAASKSLRIALGWGQS